MLRDEREGRSRRHLEAYLDEKGRLILYGQDLGPGTELVSADGEYEWYRTIAAAEVPRLAALLGARPGEDVLDVLARGFTGGGSYRLEEILRDSGIPSELQVW